MAMSLAIGGFDLFKVHWFHVLYVLFAIAATVMGTQQLYSTGTGRAVIFAIGATLTFVFFNNRWFENQERPPSRWPPTINMCPDYLTFIPTVPGVKNVNGGGCVDMLGVTSKSSGLMKTTKADLQAISSASTNQLFEFTSADVAAAKNIGDLQSICTRCSVAGLTWEGVYDGDSCLGMTVLAAQKKVAAKCNADLSAAVGDIGNSFYG
jgi:hypothetical protein